MKTRILELLLAVVLFVLPQIGITYSHFTDEATVGQNVMTAGCWVKPETPRLAYPENNSVANLGSDWLTNPYMDWGDSVTTCPTGSITYIYESYHDSGLTSLAYQSSPLSSSMIPAPGTPDGTYYWRVKAFDGTTYSDWSEVWLLTVNRTPPAPPPSVVGSVVINEVMWMGSIGNGDDEWIELRNTTGSPIDLSNWQITKWVGGTHEDLMLTIPSGKTISGNGYFLISNFSKDASAISVEPDLIDSNVALNNNDLRIKLYKDDWTNSANLIDTADDGSGTPLAGVDGANRQSMERDNDPTTGGWHTCIDVACNDTTYWDVEGNNYGTPKAANLSENDPSSLACVAPVVPVEPTPTATPELNSKLLTSPSPTIVEPTPTASPTPLPEVIITPTPSETPSLTPTPEPLIEEIIP